VGKTRAGLAHFRVLHEDPRQRVVVPGAV
jgi:hypothetical protein